MVKRKGIPRRVFREHGAVQERDQQPARQCLAQRRRVAFASLLIWSALASMALLCAYLAEEPPAASQWSDQIDAGQSALVRVEHARGSSNGVVVDHWCDGGRTEVLVLTIVPGGASAGELCIIYPDLGIPPGLDAIVLEHHEDLVLVQIRWPSGRAAPRVVPITQRRRWRAEERAVTVGHTSKLQPLGDPSKDWVPVVEVFFPILHPRGESRIWASYDCRLLTQRLVSASVEMDLLPGAPLISCEGDLLGLLVHVDHESSRALYRAVSVLRSPLLGHLSERTRD